MKTILFIAMLIPIKAAAFGILFNLNGAQQLAQVGPGGSVTSDATVVWDESKDGPLPQGAPIGYAVRVVTAGTCADPMGPGQHSCTIPSLQADATLQATYQAAQTAAATASTKAASDAAAFAAIKAKIQGGTATLPDVINALKVIVQKVGN